MRIQLRLLPLLLSAWALPSLVSATGNGAAAYTPVPATGVTAATYASSPIVSISSATPFAMIALSKDHTLFTPAYDDHTDLNSDGAVDTTYLPTYEYYGYFDPQICYTYSSASGYFVPQNATEGNYYCNDTGNAQAANTWSGNFLNWATMTRMDEVRKILYGGLRSTDGTGASAVTILQRAFLPSDTHSFAKYYDGTDINSLTPYSLTAAQMGCAAGSDSACGITICNTTAVTIGNSSESENISDSTFPPLLRAAQGDYALWATGSAYECRWSEELTTNNSTWNGNGSTIGTNGNIASVSGISANTTSPKKATNGLTYVGLGPDFNVKVQVCVSTLYGSDENCKTYPTGDLKPVGLFQIFGDANELYFGAMFGTYQNNVEGGTLVKNIGSIQDEVDVNGDGHFLTTLTSGTCSGNTCSGLINDLSLLRMVQYEYDSAGGTYGDHDSNLGSCTADTGPLFKGQLTNGQCPDWGNPFAEIYLQTIRLMAGAGVSGAFQANDSTVIAGLYTPLSSQYKDPLTASTRCTSLNVVAFNTSEISYDSNNLNGASSGSPGVKEIWGSSTDIATITNAVGTGEGMAGNYLFGGSYSYSANTVTGDQLCTPKSYPGLAYMNGICPTAPRLFGSYDTAGIAYWAHTHDIRSDLSGSQLVTTYAVSLATTTPKITIPVPSSSKTVTILPACQSYTASNQTTVLGDCSLVKFIVVSQDTAGGTGKFFVAWNSAEQGGNYDEDQWGVISYTIASGQITVTTQSEFATSTLPAAFGFVITGTTQDGFHAFSGINGYKNTDTYTGVTSCSAGCNAADAAKSFAFTVGSSTAQTPQDPLWYAAKYGAFNDQNSNSLPDLPAEWDCYNTDGSKNTNCLASGAAPDGIPDTYFSVSDPRSLFTTLERVFNAILAKTASGTAAAVVANARNGNGALYQALYEPLHQDIHGNAVTWMGTLYALFADQFGNLREDGNGNRQMDDYLTDPVVQIFFDTTDNVTKFKRFTSSSATTFTPISFLTLPLDSLNAVWNARKTLNNLTDTQIQSQRTYTAKADTGRYIFTWLGASSSGVPTTVDFLPSTFTSSNMGYLNPDSSLTSANQLIQAQNIVKWVRGSETTGMRGRTVDYDNNGTYEVERLGDIVDSTPTVVAAPQESFDILYNDTSYATFRNQYVHRRTVVYVGANDGMLHAFNGGFFNPSTNSFDLQSVGGSEVQHPLGTELWAYVPEDLLPHLKWLTQNNYPHVYYVDAKPRVFDAKIFTADTDHPNGWGTVLVVGMRFGGGPVCIKADGSTPSNCNGGQTVTLESAYVVMDITNPEAAPKLIAEITESVASTVAYTTSYPTVMTFRKFSGTTDTVNEWYLLFGSGPTDLQNAISNQDAYFFVYDLVGRSLIKSYDLGSTYASQSFAGDPVSADWDLNFYANAVYFGTAGNTAAGPIGALWRFGVDETPKGGSAVQWHAPEAWYVLPSSGTYSPGGSSFAGLTYGESELATPAVALDPSKNPWVFFGTGRFYVNADKYTNPQEGFYGLQDKNSSATSAVGTAISSTVATNNIIDVSSAVVSTTGAISSSTVTTTLSGGTLPTAPTTVTALQNLMYTKNGAGQSTKTPDGWVLNFPTSPVVTTTTPLPSTRNVSETAVIGSVFFGTAYSPDPDLCGASGQSQLYGVFYLTGTPSADTQVFGADANSHLYNNVTLGYGLASSPSLQASKGIGTGSVEVYTQTSTGAIVQTAAKVKNAPLSGEISWQQPND